MPALMPVVLATEPQTPFCLTIQLEMGGQKNCSQKLAELSTSNQYFDVCLFTF